jgi:hypothetical protein
MRIRAPGLVNRRSRALIFTEPGRRWPHDLLMSLAAHNECGVSWLANRLIIDTLTPCAQPHTTLTTTGRSNRNNIFPTNTPTTSPLRNRLCDGEHGALRAPSCARLLFCAYRRPSRRASANLHHPTRRCTIDVSNLARSKRSGILVAIAPCRGRCITPPWLHPN